MNAIDRASIHARRVFGTDAGFCDYVSHTGVRSPQNFLVKGNYFHTIARRSTAIFRQGNGGFVYPTDTSPILWSGHRFEQSFIAVEFNPRPGGDGQIRTADLSL
jgi:hypothetical protein